MKDHSFTTDRETCRETRPVRPRSRLGITAKIGAVIVIFWLAVALVGPYAAPYHPADFVSDASFGAVSSSFWLGTDYLGRDVLSRLLYGARVTMGLSFAATVLAFVVGTSLGFVAALSGSMPDTVISRIYDAFLSMPTIMLGLVAIAALGSSIPVLVTVTGLVYSCGLYRIARSLAMDIKGLDFVEAARARGEKLPWIVRREILPNVLIPLASEFGLRLVFAILFISGLSFLGLGVQPPTAEWGVMVRENLSGLSAGSAAALAPAAAIAMLTVGINLLVDEVAARGSRDLPAEMIR